MLADGVVPFELVIELIENDRRVSELGGRKVSFGNGRTSIQSSQGIGRMPILMLQNEYTMSKVKWTVKDMHTDWYAPGRKGLYGISLTLVNDWARASTFGYVNLRGVQSGWKNLPVRGTPG